MPTRIARTALIAVAALLTCTTAHVATVHAAEGGFLEMLFGLRPAPQPQPSPVLANPFARQSDGRSGYGRRKLRARYAALPVRIHVTERQKPLDMSQGAAAALLKDETLRPGDIVVFKSGAQVFAGRSGRQHTMDDFEPVKRSARVDRKTRQLLAAMTQPGGTLPADEARRLTARGRKAAPATAQAKTVATIAHSEEMRVINPWTANR